MCGSYVPRSGFPPTTHTVPSGRSNALEWYRRGNALAPAELNVFVSGLYRSAFKLAVVASSSFLEPPSASTLPFGRIVAFISIRGCDIGGPNCHWGEAADRSIISVLTVAGSPPPKIITRGLYPSTGDRGRSTEEP